MSMQKLSDATGVSVAVIAALAKILKREIDRGDWSDDQLSEQTDRLLDENEKRLLADIEAAYAELSLS